MKNKLSYLFLVLAAASVLAVGCTKKEEAPPAMPDKPPTEAPAVPEK